MERRLRCDGSISEGEGQLGVEESRVEIVEAKDDDRAKSDMSARLGWGGKAHGKRVVNAKMPFNLRVIGI